MERMSDAEWRKFVLTGTRTGKLAVTQPNGLPHVTPIWFLLDEDDVVFNTSETSLKGQALRHNPQAALCVDDQEPPYSYVLIKGNATLSLDQEELLAWAIEIGRRYMGDDRAQEFGTRNAVPGEYLVRLHIDNVIAQRAIAE
ncbi:PPOX class F420-dependent oxidoreductase [Nonomuraea sp. K274]|uniref:PPOX class F420-dependent oxidoreductase n=1 Tax=Nonomuraea cypriaca TaxID=1187855 RepID=A0A931EYU0_9ACTN|nr:PPOX class F420-dependent oxidoreductase [Nonomuraea cypriaca]MBF8185556.1 PPOX class F420-dependent oxidoreductase [Nonomuraea cypriaca]